MTLPQSETRGSPVTCPRCGRTLDKGATFVKQRRRRRRILCDFCRSVLAGKERKRSLTWAARWTQEVRDRGLAKGARYDFTAGDWRRALRWFDHRCAYCGADGRLTRDHVQPLSRAGEHTASNIVPACKPCNRAKGDKVLEVFADPATVERIRTFLASLD